MRSPKMHLVRKCVNLRKRTVPLEFLIQESRGVKKKKEWTLCGFRLVAQWI